jgi:predicted ATPase/class 3 adenylate cyclase
LSSVKEQISQLEAGIAAQEALRDSLGDAVVDAAITALRNQLNTLRTQRDDASKQLIERMRSYLPRALADKMNAASYSAGEHKQVTVLCAKITGLSALTEQADHEHSASLTNAVLKELAEAVYQYEGYVDDFSVETIRVVFGAPVTHEDDSERALRAALSMRERFERLNREWISYLSEPFTLYIGINSGIVKAGGIGSDLHISYTVVGDTVDTATCLQEVAESGQILVSPSCHRPARAAFTFVALEPIRIKGQAEPLMVYELGRARLIPGKPRGLHDLATAFVGREAEMDQLQQVMNDLEAGQGRVLAITGEAGIGKSRLMAEWRQDVEDGKRAMWLEGRCLAHSISVSYGPFLDLIRRFAGIRDEQSEETARWHLDLIIERLFPGDRDAKAIFANLLAFRLSAEERSLLKQVPGEQLRRQLFDLMIHLFTLLASKGPIMVVIEDIHWADATSLELVEHLLPLINELPLALVSVSRQTVAETPPLITAQSRYPDRFTDITLNQLSETSSLQMVCQLLAVQEIAPSLQQIILAKAEGNPFFVEEMIRTLIERGAIAQTETGAWQATSIIDAVTVPGTLHGLLMARLDRLPTKTKALGQKAAVIGRIFLYRVLRHLAERGDAINGEEVDRHLVQLEHNSLIRERARDPELEYIFHHALTQEVAYESLLHDHRRQLHRRVGEAMEVMFADRLAEFLAAIGEQYYKGEAWESAFSFLVRAGEAAAALSASSEARLLFNRALDCLAHLPETDEIHRQRVDTTIRLTAASLWSDRPEQNLQRLYEVESLATRVPGAEDVPGDAELRLARVNYWLGRVLYTLGVNRKAIVYFKKVLPVAQEYNDRELLALPSSAIAQAMLLSDKAVEAEKLFRQAIPILEETGNYKEWIRASSFHGSIVASMGDCTTGIAEMLNALDKAQEMSTLTETAMCCSCLAYTFIFTGNLPRAVEHARIQINTAEQSGDQMYRYVGYSWLSWAECRMGNYRAAAKNMARSQQIAKEQGEQLVLAGLFTAVKAETALGAGNPEEALELAKEASEIGQKETSTIAQGLARRIWGLALVALDPQQTHKAEAHLTESVRQLEKMQYRLEAARSRVELGKLYRIQGNPEAAREQWQIAADQWLACGVEHELERTQKLLAE